MPDTFSAHPSHMTLESYSLAELVEPELGETEEHLLVCERCRQIVSEMDLFAPLFRRAPDSRRRALAVFIHDTEDGEVRLEIRRTPQGRWTARFTGEKLEGGSGFASARDAYEYLRKSFEEMYPGHLCNDKCGKKE